jgi:hypothetical protein
LTFDVPDLQDSQGAVRAAPVASEFYADGKQVNLPKLKLQLLNGKMP